MFVVLGATGNTGTAAVTTLLAKGAKVRAVGRDAAKIQQVLGSGVEAFVADIYDPVSLTRALEDAEGAYVMIPPRLKEPELLASGAKMSDAITAALNASAVKRVVALSSVGAQHDKKTGPILAVHDLEQKLATVNGKNVLVLRPAAFMENFLLMTSLIKSMGFVAGGIKGSVKLPMIAARDIGEAAANALLAGDFSGTQIQELHGQRDISFDEAAHAIGAEIGKPKLSYQNFPNFMVEQALKQMGIPGKTASLMTEMTEAANNGLLNPTQPRSEKTTTPTSIEAWAKEVFVPAYNARTAFA
ncbi:MAG: NmrA family NAD(P)-binding protein [Acidobacteria bacterium]|nr:NmrA family NAD(P)-binding protein [Acidobacteriota bacterium]MBS1867580.1 NmrA family NAD(P)-binding protein [Acidobacteriota bacterium]